MTTAKLETTALGLNATGLEIARAFAPLALAALVGTTLALLAWGPGRTPALAVLLPLLWLVAPSRMSAFVLTACYHLGVGRFLPEFAGIWFESSLVGVALWLCASLVAATAWAICWPSRNTYAMVLAGALAGMVLTLAPPFGVVLAGHPLVGWGFFASGTGWFGVVLFFITVLLWGAFFRVYLPSMSVKRPQWITAGAAAAFGVILSVGGSIPSEAGGRVVGSIGAVQSRWGGYPQRGSMEVMDRIGQIGNAVQSLAGGEGELKTIVFAESVIGLYDPSLFPAIRREILNRTKETGQTVIIGADIEVGKNSLQKVALVLRPDGTSTYVAARQPVPVAEWAPWRTRHSFVVDWFADSTVAIGGGARARMMFCYEEYMPALHLISEARGGHNMVISMSNLWASKNPLTNFVQSAHTEGMALLFRRPWVRAVNLSKPETTETGA